MAENPIQVCHVVNAVGPTSIPADIAVELQQSTDIQIGVLSWFDTTDFKQMECIDLYSANPPQTSIGINTQIIKKVQNILSEFDIVHTHHPHSGAFGKIIGSNVGKKIVTTEHNNHKGYSRKGRILNGLTNSLSDVITCVSQSVYDSFRWWEKRIISSQDIEVVYNGIDIDKIASATNVGTSTYDHINVNADRHLIGISAMHTEQKAHDVLLRAISELHSQGYNIDLVITGTGPLEDSLKRLAKNEGIENHVHFLGLIEQNRLYRLLSDVDIYVMPSRWEGYCVGVAEAMALGTPCVLSDIDVFKEVYGDCALYHSVDDFNGLAATIELLLSDETLQNKLSACGSNLIQSRYQIEDVAARYESLYRHLV
ncbi:glycosyltransferase family 4 protein [Haloarcula amylolytica]|uniref:glycosyltransferase family 4 protein n=1 Tax=Haloarcula amylolytica TaxID=396317 RepID=UPI003C7209D6